MANDKTQTITAYGTVSTKNGDDPEHPEKWANDPNFVEIDLTAKEDTVIYGFWQTFVRGILPWN